MHYLKHLLGIAAIFVIAVGVNHYSTPIAWIAFGVMAGTYALALNESEKKK